MSPKQQKEFLNSWKQLENNWKQTAGLINVQLYVKVADKKKSEDLSSWLIQTSWHSFKDFIYAISTKEFQDFIDKWDIKDALLISNPVISQNQVLTNGYQLIRHNKILQKPIRISNNLLMVILWVVAIIIAGIILYFR